MAILVFCVISIIETINQNIECDSKFGIYLNLAKNAWWNDNKSEEKEYIDKLIYSFSESNHYEYSDNITKSETNRIGFIMSLVKSNKRYLYVDNFVSKLYDSYKIANHPLAQTGIIIIELVLFVISFFLIFVFWAVEG